MPSSPDLPIATERLLLRPFTRGDVDAVFAYRRREDVARYLSDGPMTRESCAEAVQMRVRQIAFAEEGDRITLAIERREGGDVVGEITLIWRNAASRQAELGYIVNPDHHRRGYGLEAARAMLALGFSSLELHRVFARCNARNTASFGLMERLQMRREAHFRDMYLVRGEWEDELIYALCAEEWAAAVV